MDYRKRKGAELALLMIQGNAVERVSSFKFLGINITNNLTWGLLHTKGIVGKAQQRLFHLRRLRKFGMGPNVLCAFYRITIESVLTGEQRPADSGTPFSTRLSGFSVDKLPYLL